MNIDYYRLSNPHEKYELLTKNADNNVSTDCDDFFYHDESSNHIVIDEDSEASQFTLKYRSLKYFVFIFFMIFIFLLRL